MSVEFRNALEVLKDRSNVSRLTTGNADLDALLGGGIKAGRFYLFYGDNDSGIDLLIHQVLVNCFLSKDKYGFDGKSVYSNCGNYREDKTLLDSNLLTSLIKTARLDPMKTLENIYVICSFSEEQQEQTISEINKLLETDNEIKLVVVHHIAKLFTSDSGSNKSLGTRVTRLQGVVLKLWQTCIQNKVAFVASCRPKKSSRRRIPPPEGGRYLRHKANAIVYLRKRRERAPYVTAYLVKHPNRTLRKVDLTFTVGGDALNRVNTPFRTLVQEEVKWLKSSYREALLDASRRDAVNSLLKVWSDEQGAMSYAQTPTVLDIMLLTGLIDNKKRIAALSNRFRGLEAWIGKLVSQLESIPP